MGDPRPHLEEGYQTAGGHILEWTRRLDTNGDGAAVDEVLSTVSEKSGYSHPDAEDALEDLIQNGELYHPDSEKELVKVT